MSFFIPEAAAQTGGAGATGDAGIIQLVMLVGIFVLFYFIAIRPQRKRQKEHESMVAELKKGDEVMTASGMLGKVTAISDPYTTIKVADGVELKFQKMAVQAVLPKGTLKSIDG